MSISRREFVLLASSAVAALAAPRAHAQSLRVRREIRSLGNADIDRLKAGVAAMRALPKTDFRSWAWQAGVHGAPAADAVGVPDAAIYWNQCIHGGPHFLSWHRWELLFIEEIIRLMSDQCSFTLPYWDYIADGFLPEPLRLPADVGNPLFNGSRSAALNDGTGALSGMHDDALDETAFTTFSSSLYGNPHSAVHGQIGGEMGSVPTAARDPVFYLHHCNIDRYWECWLRRGGGRSNPASPWTEHTFDFRTISGRRKAVVGDVGRTADLGYTYDNLPCGPSIRPEILEILRDLRLIRIRIRPRPIPEPDPWPWRAVLQFEPFAITARPTAVQLPRRELQRSQIGATLDNARSRSALVLHDVSLVREGAADGAFFEVWLAPSLRALRQKGLSQARRIGSFSSFDLSDHAGPHAHAGAAGKPAHAPITLELPEAAARALGNGDDDAAIVFVRRGLVDRSGKPLATDGRAELLRIGRLGVELRK
jgi:hypothetical protein